MTNTVWPPAQSIASARIILEPLGHEHEQGLREAVLDGELWNLVVTSAPEPDKVKAYIDMALQMRAEGTRLAHAVIEKATGRCWVRAVTTTSLPASNGWKSATHGMPNRCRKPM